MVSSTQKKINIKENISKLAKGGKINDIIKLCKEFKGFSKTCVEALYEEVKESPKLLKQVIGGLLNNEVSAEIVGDLSKHIRQNALLEEIQKGNLNILKTLEKEDSPILENREFMERAIKCNPEVLEIASANLKTDPSFMTNCIAENIECYKHMDTFLKENATFTMAMMVELNQKHGFECEALRKLASEMANDPEFIKNYGKVEGNFEDLCRTVADKKDLDNVSNPAVCDFLANATNSEVPLHTQEDKAFGMLYGDPMDEMAQPMVQLQPEDLMDTTFKAFKGVVKPMIAEFANPNMGMLSNPTLGQRVSSSLTAGISGAAQTFIPSIF
ncbi:MAG: DUF4116 domain-containing protein [Christensenellaceae bacterium]|jgi:hypothetical protein|nr:DUF4116 domain-containing protein [Christensenellaceae bacterium]